MSNTNTTPAAETLTLRDKLSGGKMWLGIRDGVVVAAVGCEPARYIDKTVERARHIARYGGK